MGHNHKNGKKQSNMDFKFMTFFFRIRDFFKPPIGKIKKAGITDGNVVLDYGCGPGSYTISAAKTVTPNGKVYAADINPLAIKAVKKKALKYDLKNIETIITDCNTGLDNNSVDVVFCFDVMHAIEDKESILKEFHRVLKPKGTFSFDDHHSEESEIESLVTSNGLFSLVEKKEKQFNFTKN